MGKTRIVLDYRINWKSTALHYDREIVRDLCMAIMRCALVDWYHIGDGIYAELKESTHDKVYRTDVRDFFNGSFFADILQEYFPDCEQENVCKAIQKADYSIRNLGDQRRGQLNRKRKMAKKREVRCL